MAITLLELRTNLVICLLQKTKIADQTAHQIEVACQFGIGTFDSTGTYCDEIGVIVRRYLTKLRGFWFDCMTSVPWSYMDFAVYVVWLSTSFPSTVLHTSVGVGAASASRHSTTRIA